MDPSLLKLACSLYDTSPDQLTPLAGGHYNAVYQFPLHETSQDRAGRHFAILRIGVEDCPTEETLGMLEWVSYLARNGAPVTTPLISRQGNLLERLEHGSQRYVITAFEKAEGTLAENIPVSEWSPELFQSIGKAAGRFHRISAGYQPSSPSLARPQWNDSYEVREATEKLAHSTDPARDKLASLVSELHKLPTPAPDFGMIHDDLHYANFLIQAGGIVTIVDYDDCVYGWYAMDVSMALFDVLVLYNAPSEIEKQRFARFFLSNYLTGYRLEKELPSFWQSQLPRFLKLKELCIYADLIDHSDIPNPDTWVGRFMRQRSARIADDMPYVDIDFSRL